MKKINLIILSIISFMTIGMNVYANNFVISAPSSAPINTNYTVSVKYSGSDKVGSLTMSFSVVDAECKSSSTPIGGLLNCNGGECLYNYSEVNSIASGSTLFSLSCKSNTISTATFKAKSTDAWDESGNVEMSISQGSASVKITGTTTTTKTTTTKSTAPPRTTTNSSTTKKNATTTTKKTTKSGNTTTKGATSAPSTTTIPLTTNENTELIPTSTTETTTTEEYSTVAVVPDDIKLKSLKIVGYDIPFDHNRINYSIEVDKDVKELYIIAEKENENTIVKNDGVVSIDGVKEITIQVSSSESKEIIEYKININVKKNSNNLPLKIILTVIGCAILVLIILRILKEIKKVKNEEFIAKINKRFSSENGLNMEPIDDKTNEYSETTLNPPSTSDVNKTNLEDTMELFEVSTESIVSSAPQLTDIEKTKIDEEDEKWLSNETPSDENVLNDIPNIENIINNIPMPENIPNENPMDKYN